VEKLNYLKSYINIVKKNIDLELKDISKLFSYNFHNFLDTRFLYTFTILSLLRPTSLINLKTQDINFKNQGINSKKKDKLISLITGIELLGVGLNFHNFNVNDFIYLLKNVNPETKNTYKRYIIDLLFGDIFYSNSVKYVLEFNDFLIFKDILESLKLVHNSRLILHNKLIKETEKNKNKLEFLFKNKLIADNETLLIETNSLLKNSFLIGYNLMENEDKLKISVEDFIDLANNFVMIKTFKDLELFLNDISHELPVLKGIKFVKDRVAVIKKNIEKLIENFKLDWLAQNLKSLAYIYFK